jgi:hypothetical protein
MDKSGNVYDTTGEKVDQLTREELLKIMAT